MCLQKHDVRVSVTVCVCWLNISKLLVERPSIINWLQSALVSSPLWYFFIPLAKNDLQSSRSHISGLVSRSRTWWGHEIPSAVYFFSVLDRQPFCMLLTRLSLFQPRLRLSSVSLPAWTRATLSLSENGTITTPSSLTPVTVDINQRWRAGGQQARVKMGHGHPCQNV